MKRTLIFLLLLFSTSIISFGADLQVEPYASKPSDAERAFVTRWVESLLGKTEGDASRYGSDVPFSFRVGERSSREWLKLENAQIESLESKSENERRYQLTWKDEATSVTCAVELTEFLDFPAFEFIVKLRNDGAEDTEVVGDFSSLDLSWNSPSPDVIPILHRSIGGAASKYDFMLRHEIMRLGMPHDRRSIYMNADTNREISSANSYEITDDKRSSAVWLPFFNYQTGGDGLIVGLGWGGRWNAYFDNEGGGHSRLRAGLGDFWSYLKPGEEVRSPSTLLLYWQGEFVRAQNMFRQVVLKHYSPKINGKMVEPPTSAIVWGETPSKRHLEIIDKIVEYKIPFDVYWLDAGWNGDWSNATDSYEGSVWWANVGDWRPNPKFHNGDLRPVSDAAHKAGMKFLLWVEPCRAVQGVPISLEHPEYFYRAPWASNPPKNGDFLLLNVGSEGGINFAIETVSDLIKRFGIDWYEEDFNLEPSMCIEPNDESGRRGMCEYRFTEGRMKFWDALRERYPNLAILNCAAGGRCIDLEMIKRGQPLWKTDYNCHKNATEEATQDQTFDSSYWLPIQGSMYHLFENLDVYQSRSALTSGGAFYTVANTDEEWALLKKNVDERQLCKKYLLGDFYPLTNTRDSRESWSAYSFFLSDEQSGLVMALRRDQSSISSMTFDLETIDPNADWTFTDYDCGKTWTVSGRELRENGLKIDLPEKRSSKLLFYSRVK